MGGNGKTIFGQLLAQFIQGGVFPEDIKAALIRSINNPSASSCADDVLLRVLKKYDEKQSHLKMVEELPEDALFKTSDGRIFKRGERLRKRFKCVEVATKRLYLFSPVYEVEPCVKVNSLQLTVDSLDSVIPPIFNFPFSILHFLKHPQIAAKMAGISHWCINIFETKLFIRI